MSKILVVDDSSTMRKIVMKGARTAAESAGKPGPQFIEAGDGMEALELLAKNEDVSVVLCDVNMPNMDGLQFVRCVRDRKALDELNIGEKSLLKRLRNRVPIVMITTESGLAEVQEALRAGATDYLPKPFTPEQLAEKIARYLD